MKKLNINILQAFIILFTISVFFSSCSDVEFNYDSDNFENHFDLDRLTIVNETTNRVSDIFLNLGVTNIKVEKNLNSTEYSFETEKTFLINNENIDFADYIVIKKENKLFLNNDDSVKLTIKDSKPYLITNKSKGFLNDDKHFEDLRVNLLLIFMDELIKDNEIKIDSSIIFSDVETFGCSFWNTYTVYAFGTGRSVAEANLTYEINFYTGSGQPLQNCIPYGLTDSSCLWENHACVATQNYCCN